MSEQGPQETVSICAKIRAWHSLVSPMYSQNESVSERLQARVDQNAIVASRCPRLAISGQY